jgi:hypothetical protein
LSCEEPNDIKNLLNFIFCFLRGFLKYRPSWVRGNIYEYVSVSKSGGNSTILTTHTHTHTHTVCLSLSVTFTHTNYFTSLHTLRFSDYVVRRLYSFCWHCTVEAVNRRIQVLLFYFCVMYSLVVAISATSDRIGIQHKRDPVNLQEPRLPAVFLYARYTKD